MNKNWITIVFFLICTSGFAHETVVAQGTAAVTLFSGSSATLEVNGTLAEAIFNSLSRKCEDDATYWAIGNGLLCSKLKADPSKVQCKSYLSTDTGDFYNLVTPTCAGSH